MTFGISGGLDVGSRSLSNLDLTAHWQGDNGWEAFGYILGDFGGQFSTAHAGDIQTTSNIDSIEGWRYSPTCNIYRIPMAAAISTTRPYSICA